MFLGIFSPALPELAEIQQLPENGITRQDVEDGADSELAGSPHAPDLASCFSSVMLTFRRADRDRFVRLGRAERRQLLSRPLES